MDMADFISLAAKLAGGGKRAQLNTQQHRTQLSYIPIGEIMMISITFKSAPGKVTECKHSSPPLTRLIVKLKSEGRNFTSFQRGTEAGNADGSANNQTLILVANSHL